MIYAAGLLHDIGRYEQMEKQQELMEQAIENGELLKPQKDSEI